MAIYLLFGKYSAESLKGISAKRSEEARALIKKHGGELKAAYATLGGVDLMMAVDLPDNAQRNGGIHGAGESDRHRLHHCAGGADRRVRQARGVGWAKARISAFTRVFDALWRRAHHGPLIRALFWWARSPSR